jgi:DNA-binding NarL/FixJ family response regulator
MRRFKSFQQAQRFPTIHAAVQNLFRYGRHLVRAANHRILRDQCPPERGFTLSVLLPGVDSLFLNAGLGRRGAILMLTASQSEADHVAGLETGSNDFVTRPIEPRVLLARIRTQLRRLNGDRTSSRENTSGIPEVGSFP